VQVISYNYNDVLQHMLCIDYKIMKERKTKENKKKTERERGGEHRLSVNSFVYAFFFLDWMKK